MYLLITLLIVFYSQIEAQTIDPLQGKSIGIIGDSYVRNHKQPVEYTWHYKFAKKHGMLYYNYGKNGNAVAIDRGRFGIAMYKRYVKMKDSLDYIIVIAGHNDAGLLDSIGGIDGYKEKLSILCKGLLEKYPRAKIFFFTCWNCKNFQGSNFEKIVDVTIEVCRKYTIPVFDSARKSNIFAQDDQFRKIYFQSPTDHAHLNAKGHDRFLPVAEKFILDNIK